MKTELLEIAELLQGYSDDNYYEIVKAEKAKSCGDKGCKLRGTCSASESAWLLVVKHVQKTKEEQK